VKDKNLFYKELANNLLKARESSGLNQEQVANAVSLSRVSIINIEKGRQKANMFLVWQLCQIYNVEISHVIPVQKQVSEHSYSIENMIEKKTQKHLLSIKSQEKLRSFLSK
jgi:DNA-binding XRE family transcriptional regulator